MSPGVPVAFSKTVLYAAEAMHVDGRWVHVLGYQNRVKNQRSFWARVLRARGARGNAMLLPFPAAPGSMTEENVVDTSGCPSVLDEYARAIQTPPRVPGSTSSQTAMASIGAPAVQVFDAGGIYTVVLARDAREIPAALERVSPERRPALNEALFAAYARWYPRWTVALCCFNNDEAMKADPMVWWYEPLDRENLFLPALDCHTGGVPSLDSMVTVDHVVAVGSNRGAVGYGTKAFLPSIPDAAAPYFVREVVGGAFTGRLQNGDFVVPLDDVRAGRFQLRRELPPGA